MKSRISELMDGELDRAEAEALVDGLRAEGEGRDAWRAYHLAGDAMRGTRPLSEGFSARLAERLAAEPTVLAPRPRPVLSERRWQLLGAAASLAAVAFVASVAFGPHEGSLGTPPVAIVAPAAEPVSPVAAVDPPEAAQEYLLAHQGYSPRNSMQGMAPYVRTVSSDIRGNGR